ncbi:hypothetical protein CDAR_299951 [Caerostris darwini]|uniref:Uncharacterized protein n=1 Tax=Caerostris darwini TaxID=1538125 RepID=A0AAV4W5D3_9ARAC|nr:hypothetical protein CDAR_299951 [Caerostris darwini]
MAIRPPSVKAATLPNVSLWRRVLYTLITLTGYRARCSCQSVKLFPVHPNMIRITFQSAMHELNYSACEIRFVIHYSANSAKSTSRKSGSVGGMTIGIANESAPYPDRELLTGATSAKDLRSARMARIKIGL